MGKESDNTVPGLQSLNRMVSEPYYLFHFLTFFSYFIIRTSASEVLAPHLIQHLLRRVRFSLPFALSHASLHRLLTLLLLPLSGNTNAACVRDIGCHQGSRCSNQIQFYLHFSFRVYVCLKFTS